MVSRVLVVDDNHANRIVPKAILGKHGIDCAEVDSGFKALDLLSANTGIGFVLADVNMPGMNGAELLARIRSDAGLDQVKVIAYTAHAFEHNRQELLAKGFDAVLVKPITVDALLTTLFELGLALS